MSCGRRFTRGVVVVALLSLASPLLASVWLAPIAAPLASYVQQGVSAPNSSDDAPDRTAPAPDLLTGLVGSPHDFTRIGRRDLCTPCHTPHWSERIGDEAVVEPAEPLRPFQSTDVTLTGWSLMCLSCHDGVTATDVYTKAHAFRATGPLAGSRWATTGTRSHPIGIRYPAASVEKYNAAAAVEARGLPLPGGAIQCTTCHDPHNAGGHAGMLRISNERSNLCLACHQL